MAKQAPSVATDAALEVALPSRQAVGKLIGDGGEILRDGRVTLVTGRAYATTTMSLPAEEIYFDLDSTPDADGPWLGEADKVSWRDEASGYDCIMLRDTHRGFLSGYVGVPRDHPLWGWESEAVTPDLGVEVHGGLTYSELCEDGPSPQRRVAFEARRICHVPIGMPWGASGTRSAGHGEAGGQAWWFGFSCNHIYDIIPDERGRHLGFLKAEVGPQYRDDAYVARETSTLAAQLRAVADGAPMPDRRGAAPPPIGLDPRRGGGHGGV